MRSGLPSTELNSREHMNSLELPREDSDTVDFFFSWCNSEIGIL